VRDRQLRLLRYHAHSETQRADGLYGGLIVHDPQSDDQELYQYDEEILLMIGDWYHDPAIAVLESFMTSGNDGNEVSWDSVICE
jgi:FtsP/CotA-like multicopper oxidase with cupredoxin domain